MNIDISSILYHGKHFRKLKLSDYDIGYVELLSQLTEVGNISKEEFKNRFNEINDNKYLHIYVICDEDKNELIASGTLYIEPKFIHNCSKVGHIEDIVVGDKYRGKNYGWLLVNQLVHIARVEKCYKIVLACKDNLVSFYEKINFKKENNELVLRLTTNMLKL
jgi:glucosamine-phosphate N-acetyltransferase